MGSPVALTDPSGLRVVLQEDYKTCGRNVDYVTTASEPNYKYLIYVVRYDDAGLPVLGHTQLYFWDGGDNWSYTEFTTTAGSNGPKEKKKNARVFFEDGVVAPMYNKKTGEFEKKKGMDFVVVEGDFNDCVELARRYDYANGDMYFGKYNMVGRNCSDYTDEIISKAKVEGRFTQAALGQWSLVSIPSERLTTIKEGIYKDIYVRLMARKIKENIIDPFNEFVETFRHAFD